MGLFFSSNKESFFGMDITRQVVDKSKVGDVYLVAYNQGSAQTTQTQEKRAHYSVIIDVAGESTDQTINGVELHLVVTSLQQADPQTTFLANGGGPRLKSKLLKWAKVGKIENLYHPGQPYDWAFALGLAGNTWANEFYESIRHSTWSAQCNCQQFTRFLLKKFQIEWPSDFSVIGDFSPLLVDSVMQLILLTKST
jgi:hypothetical protein